MDDNDQSFVENFLIIITSSPKSSDQLEPNQVESGMDCIPIVRDGWQRLIHRSSTTNGKKFPNYRYEFLEILRLIVTQPSWKRDGRTESLSESLSARADWKLPNESDLSTHISGESYRVGSSGCYARVGHFSPLTGGNERIEAGPPAADSERTRRRLIPGRGEGAGRRVSIASYRSRADSTAGDIYLGGGSGAGFTRG